MPKMDGLELLREIAAAVSGRRRRDDHRRRRRRDRGELSRRSARPTTSSSRISSRTCARASRRRSTSAACILENRAYRESLEERVSRAGPASSRSCSSPAFNRSPRRSSSRIRTRADTRCASARTPARSPARWDLHGEMLRQIELGGHVHDIGKIGVRETVLNKAERLTAEEYEHIMTHPVLGWRILAPLLGGHAVRAQHRALAPRAVRRSRRSGRTRAAARSRSRRASWPSADALDAMTSDRPYRPSEMSLVRRARRDPPQRSDPVRP